MGSFIKMWKTLAIHCSIADRIHCPKLQIFEGRYLLRRILCRAILPNLPFLTKIMRLNPQIADISLDAFLKNLYRSG